MDTQKVPVDPKLVAASVHCPRLATRLKIRMLSTDEFIEQHASGTLRKNKRLGMAYMDQYIEERTAYEFGWGFRCLPRSRITFGDAYTESESSSVTEAGWHIERYSMMTIFEEDYFECKYLHVENKDGTTQEGIGIVVRQTSASFVPPGNIVFAIVAEFIPGKGWAPAENPF